MTGTNHNSREEIWFILTQHRLGVKKSVIASRCDQEWKHRKRTVNSITYIINKYKDNPEFDEYLAPTAFTAPAIPTNLPNYLKDLRNVAAARHHEIQEAEMNAAAQNPGQRVQSGAHMGHYHVNGSYPQTQYNPESSVSSPAWVGTGQALRHPQDQTMSRSKGYPRSYQDQGVQFSPSLGSNPNLSYTVNNSGQPCWDRLQTSQHTTDPCQLDYLSSMAGRSIIQENYSIHSGSLPVQHGGVHRASAMNPEQRRFQIEAFRQYQARIGGKQTQSPGGVRSSQNSLAQVIDPSLESHTIIYPAQYPQLRGYDRSLQPSPIAQGSQQNTSAIRPPPSLSLMQPSHYHQPQGYESNQQHSSAMIQPQLDNSPLLSNHRMQTPGPTPPPANASAQIKNQILQNLHQKPSSPNKLSPLNQPHHQITYPPKPWYASNSSAHQSSQQGRIPDITLHKLSKNGKGSLKTHDNFVSPGLLNVSGWNVVFGEKVSPPPGSVVHEFYNPQLRFNANGIPFMGEALNESEFEAKVDNAGAVPPALDDIDTLLAFESPRPDNAVTKSTETYLSGPTIRHSPHPTKQPSSVPQKLNTPPVNPYSLLSQVNVLASTATAPLTETAPGQQCKVTAAPYTKRLNTGPLPPRGATMGTLTLPTTPANPIQPLKPVPQHSYVPQAGFRSRPSMGPKAKKSKLQTEPIPQSEPQYVMNHAKTGIITESASLNNIPGYKEKMAVELARTRKENERRFKAETEQWEADRRKEQLGRESRTQSTSSTSSLILTKTLSTEASTTPTTPHSPKTQSYKRKLDEITPSDIQQEDSTKRAKISHTFSPSDPSTSPPTPHIPHKQSNKRKLDNIASSENTEVESAKKSKPSTDIQGVENRNQQQIAPKYTADGSASSAPSHKHTETSLPAASTSPPTLYANTPPNKNKRKLHDLLNTPEEHEEAVTKKARLETPIPWSFENMEFDRGRPEDPFWLDLPEFSDDGFPLDWFEGDARLGGDKSGANDPNPLRNLHD